MSAIAVSDSNMFGGGEAACRGGTRYCGEVGLQPGLESKVVKEVYARSIFNLFMPTAGPLFQVTNSSQPLLLFSPGRTGLARVDALTWPPGLPSLVFFYTTCCRGRV